MFVCLPVSVRIHCAMHCRVADYCGAMQTFLKLVPVLVSQQIDADLRLQEQTLLVTILCSLVYLFAAVGLWVFC